MILYPVYSILWMLQAHTDSNPLSLKCKTLICKKMVYVSRRMAGGKYNRTLVRFALCRCHTCNMAHTVFHFNVYRYDSRSKIYDPATALDCLTHSLDNGRQAIRTNMWMSIYKYITQGAVLMEYIENDVNRTTFATASV